MAMIPPSIQLGNSSYMSIELHKAINSAEQNSSGKVDGKVSKQELENYLNTLDPESRDSQVTQALIDNFDQLENNKDQLRGKTEDEAKKDGILSVEDINIESQIQVTLSQIQVMMDDMHQNLQDAVASFLNTSSKK